MPAEKGKAAKPKKTVAKVMDVSKPGKSTPAATSKPVIVGHKMMKDPMVSKSSAETEEKPEAPGAPLPHSGKVIKPITITEDGELQQSPKTKDPELTVGDAMAAVVKQPEDTEPVAEPETPAAEEPTEPETPPPAEEVEPETPPVPEKETPAAEPDTAAEEPLGSDDTAVVDAVADQAIGKKKQTSEESEEEKQKRENIEKLIAEKKYFVPTGQVTKKRHTQWAVIFLLLLVTVIAVLAAIDAEVLDIGVKLPFDLVKL
ncbi:MAG TPA: hypothetical protein VK694_00065 [Verrucomicrobiae bacterium]|nr:hypothetical protein [Verrucomicrobiae bacterium]